MRKLLTFTLITLLTGFGATAKAAAEVKIGGESRTMFLMGATTLNATANDWNTDGRVYERARLKFDVNLGQGVSLKFVPQYAGTWGEASAFGTSSNVEGSQVSIHEAYVQFENFLGSTVKVGRQEVTLGIGRFICNKNYANTGLSLDGILIAYNTSAGKLIGFGSRIDDDTVGTADENLAALSWQGNMKTFGLGGSYEFEYIDFNVKTRPWTAYVRISPAFGTGFGKLGLNLEYAKQGGDTAAGSSYDGSFYNVSAKLGQKSWGAEVGYEFYSGDDGTTADVESLNPLYWAGHKFLGLGDYYTGFVGRGIGAKDTYVKLSFKPLAKTKVGVQYHYVKTDIGSTTAGQEVDFTASYKYTKNVSFFAGVYVIMPDKSYTLTNVDTTGTKGEITMNVRF
ncbi:MULTISPECIES: alginate export family protein [unclassified Desulfurobacterium]|uniref:alginate export family protein n=1 Tax=Desulfurobacterium sp. TC5-1 TaxID=1158318 RepID=UPI0003B50031|nr:alginate export family protein [Desulfurobacterium sp. TC5-1]